MIYSYFLIQRNRNKLNINIEVWNLYLFVKNLVIKPIFKQLQGVNGTVTSSWKLHTASIRDCWCSPVRTWTFTTEASGGLMVVCCHVFSSLLSCFIIDLLSCLFISSSLHVCFRVLVSPCLSVSLLILCLCSCSVIFQVLIIFSPVCFHKYNIINLFWLSDDISGSEVCWSFWSFVFPKIWVIVWENTDRV